LHIKKKKRREYAVRKRNCQKVKEAVVTGPNGSKQTSMVCMVKAKKT